jgi:competence protein ComEA
MVENLNGVGMHKAQAIIDYREQHGEFESINDLLHVKGIGPSTLERNGDSLLIE